MKKFTSFIEGVTKDQPRSSLTVTDFFDPSIEQYIDVSIDRIKRFEQNPREVRNAKYLEIKASIKLKGLENKLVITRRPADEPDGFFILATGGGTRLQILEELYQETDDDKYKNHKLRFVPYISELDLLLKHASENGNRSDTLWFENAKQAERICQAITDDNQDGKKLSLRSLAKSITERGWKLDHTRLREYRYTVEHLCDVIQIALNAGMGRPKVRSIMELDRKYRTWVTESSTLDERDFKLCFYQALKSSDGEAFDTKEFECRLRSAVAIKASIDESSILTKHEEKQIINTGFQSSDESHETPASSRPKTTDAKTGISSSENHEKVPDSTKSKVLKMPGSASSSSAIYIEEGNHTEESINAAIAIRAKEGLSIAKTILGYAESLSEQTQLLDLSEQVDDIPPLSIGFAVSKLSDSFIYDESRPLDTLIYMKLQQWFHIGVEGQANAELLNNLDLDEIATNFGLLINRDNIELSHVNMVNLFAYEESMRVRALVATATEIEQQAIASFDRLNRLLAEHLADLVKYEKDIGVANHGSN